MNTVGIHGRRRAHSDKGVHVSGKAWFLGRTCPDGWSSEREIAPPHPSQLLAGPARALPTHLAQSLVEEMFWEKDTLAWLAKALSRKALSN